MDIDEKINEKEETKSQEHTQTDEASLAPNLKTVKLTVPEKPADKEPPPAKTITKTRKKGRKTKAAPKETEDNNTEDNSNTEKAKQTPPATESEKAEPNAPTAESEDDDEFEIKNIPDTTQLKKADYKKVKTSLGRSNINDNTLRTYISAYSAFVERIKELPNEDKKSDDKINRYVEEMHRENPRPGNLAKMNQLISMLKIMNPRVFVSIPLTKVTIKNWKKSHNPQSATAINSLMARAFAAFLQRMGEPFAAAALIIQQAALLRPCEVLALTSEDIRLPGDFVLEGAGEREAGLIITNGKTAKHDKPQLAMVKDDIEVKVLEIVVHAAKDKPASKSIFGELTYAQYSKCIQQAAQFYGLKDFKVTPHGACLGGAVEIFNSNESLDDITVGGRWAEPTSAVAYIKNGKASLAKINMNDFMQSELRRYAQLFIITVERKWRKIQKKNPPENSNINAPNAI